MFSHSVAVMSVSCASIERFESERPAQTTVIDLLEALNEKRTTVDNEQVEYEEETEEYYYDDDEEDDESSGDYALPLGNYCFFFACVAYLVCCRISFNIS